MNFQFTPYLASISKCKLNVHEADTNCIQNSDTLLLCLRFNKCSEIFC